MGGNELSEALNALALELRDQPVGFELDYGQWARERGISIFSAEAVLAELLRSQRGVVMKEGKLVRIESPSTSSAPAATPVTQPAPITPEQRPSSKAGPNAA